MEGSVGREKRRGKDYASGGGGGGGGGDGRKVPLVCSYSKAK